MIQHGLRIIWGKKQCFPLVDFFNSPEKHGSKPFIFFTAGGNKTKIPICHLSFAFPHKARSKSRRNGNVIKHGKTKRLVIFLFVYLVYVWLCSCSSWVLCVCRVLIVVYCFGLVLVLIKPTDFIIKI